MNINQEMKKICVFCGSNTGILPSYRAAAEVLADDMSRAGLTLIYGGAKIGLMGIIADRMLNHGAHVIGIIPQLLTEIEVAHEGLTRLHIVDTMHERKVRMIELADSFIMLPGGSGSLDEFFEVFTLAQLGYHAKPFGILNVDGYYDYLLKFLDHAVAQGFLNPSHLQMMVVEESSSLLIEKLCNYQQTNVQWIEEPVCQAS